MLEASKTYINIIDTPLDTRNNKIFKPCKIKKFFDITDYSNKSRIYPQTPETIAKMMANQSELERRHQIELRVRNEKSDTHKHQDFLDEMLRINKNDQIVRI